MYFSKGRVRLVHSEGPEFTFHTKCTYYACCIKDNSILNFGISSNTREELEKGANNINWDGRKLYEEFEYNNKNYRHPSRGIPNFVFRPRIDELKQIIKEVDNALYEDDYFNANAYLFNNETKKIIERYGFSIYSPYASDDLYVMLRR